MEIQKNNWTENEFLTYLLLYCAQSDFIETDEEKAIIEGKTSHENYMKIHKEIEGDNDFASIKKISNYLSNHHHSKGDMELIKESMKELFESDGDYDILESNLFRSLKRIMRMSND